MLKYIMQQLIKQLSESDKAKIHNFIAKQLELECFNEDSDDDFAPLKKLFELRTEFSIQLRGVNLANFIFVYKWQGKYYYQHADTKRYLIVDKDGECYQYDNNKKTGDFRIFPISRKQALQYVFS